MTVGERVRDLRQLNEMSQEELGRRVGVQRAAINKYEKGTVENIPIKTIEKISNVFDVAPTYLVGWESNPDSELAWETRTIKGVARYFGQDAVVLLEVFTNLNPVGRAKVVQYAHDIEFSHRKDK